MNSLPQNEELAVNVSPERMDEAIFRAGPLVNLAAVVRSLGCNPAPIFSRAGFELDDFSDPDHRLPFIKGSRLLADCAKVTGCDHIGLLLGQRADPSHLGIAGFLLRAAPSARLALQALIQNLDLHDEGGSLSLEVDTEFSTLVYSIQLPGTQAVEQIYDLSVALIYKIMHAMCGPDWVASCVRLARRQPENIEIYRRYFHSTLYFNAAESGITFQSRCLDQKPPAADSLLFDYLQKEARQLHEIQHHEILEELPAVLRRALLTEKFSAQDIADKFGIHERTLHRRLRDEGTGFRQELDRARQSVSEQLLGSTSLPVCDIATALGYSGSSGFIRAFQRWCGTSPTTWRKTNNPHLHNGY